MTTPIGAVDPATSTRSVQAATHHRHDPTANLASSTGAPPPKAAGHHGGGRHAKVDGGGRHAKMESTGVDLTSLTNVLDNGGRLDVAA